MKTVNIGVIGAGGIANKGHLPAYQKCEGARIVAIADPSESAVAATAERFGITQTYTSYADLLARDDIDAVSVCTPNFLHRDVAVDALRAGKHVLVEKPLAVNAAQAAEIVDTARETGRKCMVAFVSRFGAEAKALKRFVDAGELGDIYYARAQYLRRRGIPGWGVFGHKDKQGGGPLIDVGVHALDTALWLMGHPKPVSATAISVCKFGKRADVVGLLGQWDRETFTVEDFSAGFIRFENGAALVLEAAWALNVQPQQYVQVSLMGDLGGADMFPPRIYSEKHGVLVDSAPLVQPADGEGFTEEIASFVAAVANDTEVPIPAEDGLMATRIIDAFYESAETGLEVALS